MPWSLSGGLGFRIEGFRVKGFRDWGLGVLGFRVSEFKDRNWGRGFCGILSSSYGVLVAVLIGFLWSS